MKGVKKVLGVVLLVLLLGALVLMVKNPRYVSDWIALRGYIPSQRVVEIADTTTMTDKARRVFYVYDPQIETSEVFNKHCTIREVSIVLGCYDGSGIYVYDVADPRLKGVQEITSAHEMLHAEYDRLSQSERERIDSLTQKQFQTLSNERILTTIKAYRARDPSIVPNELHSILATEVRNLDPGLEEHYRQYFTDRAALVTLSESYEQVFTDIKAKVERLDAELILLKAQIDALEADLGSRADEITVDRAELDSLSASKNTAEYNARVPSYNQSVESYNTDLEKYRGLIREYNTKVETRNSVTVEQNDLIDSLSSNANEL